MAYSSFANHTKAISASGRRGSGPVRPPLASHVLAEAHGLLEIEWADCTSDMGGLAQQQTPLVEVVGLIFEPAVGGLDGMTRLYKTIFHEHKQAQGNAELL